MQQWHKKKVVNHLNVTSTHYHWTLQHIVQLDLEIYFQLFFWPALYATPGTSAYMETRFQYKQVY